LFEIDFLPVGDGERSGDAIALRYSNPTGPGYIVGIVDAGFSDDGDALVAHVQTHYKTNAVDFVLSTHPDEDHINGMGTIMRELNVGTLLIHRPAQHGHSNNSGARPAEELVALAKGQAASFVEPFTGVGGFGGSFLIAGPTEAYYEQLLGEQAVTSKASVTAKKSLAERYLGTAATAVRRVLDSFPGEIFFDDAGGTNPRNNSAAILSLMIDGKHMLLPSDAGVPAINQAMDYLDSQRRTLSWPNLLALPHHGSRHNLDRATIERVLGGATSEPTGIAVASISPQSPKYPSPRVANAAGRRGYPVFVTNGGGVCHRSADSPQRDGWTTLDPLPPLAETDHD
jgi:beta-lactamase superfamily II metal-dependent hydrolase